MPRKQKQIRDMGTTTILIISISWYLIGLIGNLLIFKKSYGHVTLSDIVMSATLGGLLGIISVLLSFTMSPLGDKKIF